MNPFSNPIQTEREREGLRQLIRPVGEAIGVGFVASAAILLALLGDESRVASNAALRLLPAAVLVVFIVVQVYSSRRHSLAAMRLSALQNARLSSVIEGTGVGIWEADLQLQQAMVSDRWSAMLGLQRDNTVPLSHAEWRSRIHPDDVDAVIAARQMSLNTPGHVYTAEHRLRHEDGHWIWVVARGRVVERDASGVARLMVGNQIDVSERKAAEQLLRESEDKFRSLFERCPVGIALSEFRTGKLLQANDALLDSSGYSRDELLNLSYDHLVQQPESGIAVVSAGQPEREFRRKDGSRCPVLISGIRMTDAGGKDVVWTIVQDISQRKTMERELAAAARRDRLTGLANRTMFIERLQTSVDCVRAGEQKTFAVLFLDFDRFKVVNDAMGHQAGDDLLSQIAERLRKCLRAKDMRVGPETSNLIARFGGDEFLILLNDLEESGDAMRVAERVLNALMPVYLVQGREVHSSASIGIVTSDLCLEGAETIIRNADVAMYEAKRAGRARCVLFNEDMHTRLSRNLLIETNLRQAIGTPQMTLVYQPIVELTTGRHTSVEALIRWNHPVFGPISPGEFVPVAEDSGLIAAMGEWVMKEACAAMSRWRAADPVRAPHVVSVNVSRAELARGQRLLDSVQAALRAADLPAECLLLEVTEREVMRDSVSSRALMNELQSIGVRLAMDDFGTGTSSLACLREYPFDIIKIDQSFVSGLEKGPDTLAVIHATITLIENLGKTSVAEGVETAEQLAILQSLGCHYAQGYYLGRPVPEADVMGMPRNSEQARTRQRA
jgi:diguanylate cyclase (GGDEF)-like protein/PAS domain S-box-containing protein